MARIAEALVAAVFLGAGLLKVWDPPGFALSIARLGVLPEAAIGLAAIVLPWIELLAAVALLARPAWRGAGRALIGILLVAFTLALAAAVVRGGASTACGCFGVEGGVLARADVGLVRNMLLLALLAPGLRRRSGPPPAPPGSSLPAR